MAINLSDLPPKYQAQAMQKYMQAEQRRKLPPSSPPPFVQSGSKYNNQPDTRATISFDSKKEARRFDDLMVMLQAGQISDLRLQVDFTLQEAYTDTDGKRVRAIRYKADFTYKRITPAGATELVVEDVKSKPTKTKVYAVKKKMLKERFGIEITEV